MEEYIDKCSFLSTNNGGFTINKGQKYYTKLFYKYNSLNQIKGIL